MSMDLDSVDFSRVRARFLTDKGEIVVAFFPDRAPRTVRNFLELADKGFYDGQIFHRVIKDFMVQGGCPEGTGTGGPGYTIEAEFNDTLHERGVISMARSRHPDSAGSQFFFVHNDHAAHLDNQYTAFGRIVDGLDVLDALASVECEFGPGGERSRPVEDLKLEKVVLSVAEEGEETSDEEADEANEEQQT
mgnify:CR=1 FL=1